KYFSTGIGKIHYALHHGAKAGYSATTQIIPIRKAAWKYNAIFSGKHAQVLVFMPKHDHFLSHIILQCIMHITIAIRAWKNNNAEFHSQYLVIKSKDILDFRF